MCLLFSFWKNVHFLSGQFESTLFVSFFGVVVYFYTISSGLGTSTWIVYGLIAGGANLVNVKSKLTK
jgi:hypothetical protein